MSCESFILVGYTGYTDFYHTCTHFPSISLQGTMKPPKNQSNPIGGSWLLTSAQMTSNNELRCHAWEAAVTFPAEVQARVASTFSALISWFKTAVFFLPALIATCSLLQPTHQAWVWRTNEATAGLALLLSWHLHFTVADIRRIQTTSNFFVFYSTDGWNPAPARHSNFHQASKLWPSS